MALLSDGKCLPFDICLRAVAMTEKTVAHVRAARYPGQGLKSNYFRRLA
jgi:hypothetical protein